MRPNSPSFYSEKKKSFSWSFQPPIYLISPSENLTGGGRVSNLECQHESMDKFNLKTVKLSN